MHSWTEYVFMAVEILLFCAVIAFCTILNGTINDIQRMYSSDTSVTEELKEYRLYNAYDSQDVYAQDVIALILQYKGEYTIKVTVGSNVYTFNKSNLNIQNVADLTDRIKQGAYTSQVNKGGNGQIIGFTFVKK